MGKTITFLLAILFTLSSAQAEDKVCTVTVKTYNSTPDVQKTNELIREGNANLPDLMRDAFDYAEEFQLKQYVGSNVKSWETCYKLAIAKAKKFPYSTLIPFRQSNGSKNVIYGFGLGKIFVEWSYDLPGWQFLRSYASGEVTRYSNPKAAQGDERRSPQGGNFKDTL